jgi:predicted transcriptional regulator of viral defense system
MRSIDFFETHPVFRHEEFLAVHTSGGRSPRTSNNLLARHLASGRLIRVRRGLYAVVPRGVDPGQATPDPYLVATNLAEDAVVAYHAALQFHGKSYSVWRRFHYQTHKRARALSFRDMEFVPVQVSKAFRSSKERGEGVSEVPHAGGRVRVTTMERTMVDVLDQPDKCGGWEEIWRSLELVEFFDLDTVIAHALKVDSSLTAARVGFFLDQHRESLMVEEKHLKKLQAHAPRQPRYLDNTRRPGKLVAGWNLVVPEYVLERRWEEAG